MRTAIFVLLMFLFTRDVIGQNMKPIKWVVRPSFGYTVPVSKLSKGYITDNLVGYDSPAYYWQFISSSYFFNDWGIEFSFQANHNASLNDRHARFSKVIEEKYSGDYYVSTSSGAMDDTFNYVGGSIEKGSLGPVYKKELKKLIFIARALIGVTSFYTEHAQTDLKRKGTNERLHLSWSTGKVPKDNFTFNPSFTIGYRIFDRVVIDFDLNYWIYTIDFDYTETITNLYTHEVQYQKYNYSDVINELSFGLGFMIIIK